MRSDGPDTFCKIYPDLLCIAINFVKKQSYFERKLQNRSEMKNDRPNYSTNR